MKQGRWSIIQALRLLILTLVMISYGVVVQAKALLVLKKWEARMI